MFVIPGVAALLTFEYWRLHELFDGLRWLSLNFVLGLAFIGYLIDYGIGVSRPRSSPLLLLLGAFYFYVVAGVAIKAPNALMQTLIIVGVAMIAFVLVSEGLQSLRALAASSVVILVFTLALAAVGIQQGLAPSECYVAGGGPGGKDVPDGRKCAMVHDCIEGGKPDADYYCEHPGIFGTHSIGGRVRFRGILEDPNELAWVISLGMPLAFALYQTRRSWPRLVLLAAVLVGGSICVIMTKSRSGQLALLAVFGLYFVRRFGWRGLIFGAVAGLPVLLLGGRSDVNAESSSNERLECWAEALSMWRGDPMLGVGALQFTEHHHLTAHNSFLLTLAELGPIGLVLWSAAMYFAFKITIQVQRDLAANPDAGTARLWATALSASMAGTAVSAFFLSIPYSSLLWMVLGLVGALYAAVRVHLPGFRVRFGWKDLALVVGADVGLVVLVSIYLRFKGV